MRARIISGLLLIAIGFVLVLNGGLLLIAGTFGLIAVSFYELLNTMGIIKKGENNTFFIIGLLGVIFYHSVWVLLKLAGPQIMPFVPDGDGKTLVPFVFSFFVVLMLMSAVFVLKYPKYSITDLANSVFAYLYSAGLLSFIYITRESNHGIFFAWLIFFAASGSDVFAFAFGIKFGKHKLSPVLSPKKSIEGSVAGIVCAAIICGVFGWLVAPYMVSYNPQWIIVSFTIIGAVGAALSQLGDLLASGIKRSYNVKDYGNVIPGHGGIMDRFDSIMVVAPIVYVVVKLL